MVELRGMTIKELNDVLDDMHSVYPFQNDKTMFGSIRDIRNMTPNNVEIITTDEKTGVQIIMSKAVTAERFADKKEAY